MIMMFLYYKVQMNNNPKMKKLEIVKDKQKLFQKLFISPSYFQPIDPPLLVSPDFIHLLIEQSTQAPRKYQLSLIDDILNVFNQRPTNSLLLCAHDQDKLDTQKCILDSIIIRILNLIQTQQQVELYLQRIVLMLAYYRITLCNFRKLTQWISKMSYIEKFDPIKFMFIARLMRIYYSKKLGESKAPLHYFYIFGAEGSGIQPILHPDSQILFKSQLTIVISFNSQGPSTKPYNLFLIKTEKKQQIGLTFSQGCLKLTALRDGEFLDEFVIIKGLSQQVWYRLIINMNSTETECILDSQTYIGKALLKKERERKIIGSIFGREFFGMISNILVSNKAISLQKFDLNNFPYGIDSLNQLVSLNKTSIPANVIVSCLPFCTFEVREVLHCFDIFHRNHSNIADNIIVIGKPISQDNIDHMGGCTILLPLFYLSRFYNRHEYPSLLEDLLTILIQILKTYNIQKIESQLEQTNFIQILGQHLADIPHLHNQKSLNLVFSILKILKKQKIKLTFIRDLIWSLNIGIPVPSISPHQKHGEHVEVKEVTKQNLKQHLQPNKPSGIKEDESQTLIKLYYKLILNLYQTESKLAYKSMSFAQITYWAVQHLEANHHMIFCCCLQHYLNQTVLSNDINTDELIKIDSSKLKSHYLYLSEILSKYMQNFIKTNHPDLFEHLKTLLRLLLQKYSACFYLMILKIIRKQIDTLEKKTIGVILASPKLQIISFLVFLSEKTINPDILTEILYIALFVQKFSPPKKKQEITNFIISLLKINLEISIKNFNPITKLAKKVRKNSAIFQINKLQEQVQQNAAEKNDLNKSFSHFVRKKQSTNQKRQHLLDIISRAPQTQRLSNYSTFYNLILNQLSEIVSIEQPVSQGVFYSQQSILILKHYYKLAQPLFKQNILLFILISLEKNSQLRNSKALTIFLLESLKQSLYVLPKQTKNLFTIFTCIFSQIIQAHSSILDYYSSIKFLKFSRSAISLILPHVLSKVIKLTDLPQLCDLMMVCLYQMLEGAGESACELGILIICEFNDRLLKLAQNGKEPKQNKSQNKAKSYQANIIQFCQIFNTILCSNPQRQPIKDLVDPFEQKIFEKQSVLSMQSQYLIDDTNVDLQLKNIDNEVDLNSKQENKAWKDVIKTEQNSQDEQNNLKKDSNNGVELKVQRKCIKQKVKQSGEKVESKQKIIMQKQSVKSNKKLQNSISQQNAAKQQNLYYTKQLTVIEVYIKLIFKILQKYQTEINKIIRQSYNASFIASSQSSSYNDGSLLGDDLNVPIRKKSTQFTYSYDFKSKEKLANEFLQVISIYFKNMEYNTEIKQKGLIKFLLTYILYKIYSLKQIIDKEIVRADNLLEAVFINTILPFMDEQMKQLLEIAKNIASLDAKTSFLSFFTRIPLKYTMENLLNWRLDQEIMRQTFDNEVLNLMFEQETKYAKFLKILEDNHDLIIAGFFQKNMETYIKNYQMLMLSYASEKNFKNIQKLFDTENAAEEKTRIAFLYENQCRFRKYHYEWDKIWNKLRIYHQPYGFWMAQKFKDNVYTYPKDQIRNFKFQMSEYSSDSGLYPILQAKIIESWNIIRDNRLKKNIYINSFSEMMKPSHIKMQKTQSQNNIFTNLWKGMLGLSKRNLNWPALSNGKEKVKEYEVVYISRSTKATGKLFIQNKQELFFCYEGARQEDTHLSFQKFSLAFNRETYQKWSLYQIQRIKVHRYLLKYSALKIIFSDGRSVIFNFVKEGKQDFLKQIQKIQKEKLNVNTQKLYKLNKVSFFQQNFFEGKGIDPKITEKWIKREISNLQYLSQVNKAASRGIYDLSQYMVVPWIVQFKKQKEPKYRDLTKTMGGLGSEDRKKIICEKYFAKDPFNPYPPFFFGTHYSSPGVVFNFLIRLSPFTEYCKHLQGGKFDIPDRLFSSLISAWRSASQEVSDVRELIPEMYYLPQIFINIDQNYFGFTQNLQLINHIEIPPWGANNPYFFTSQMRQLFESQQVSQKINEWIDLIFGYKQKGKEAQQNYNIYYYLTYQDYAEIQGQEEDDVYIKSKQAQIVHFGQIPPMLFDKPHLKRNILNIQGIYQIKIIKTINLMISLKQKPIGIKIQNNQLLICKRNELQVYSIQSDPASLQKRRKFNFEKSMTDTYYLIKKEKSNVYFFEKPYFIIWGYLSNEFRIFNKNTGEINESDQIPSKILYLHVNKAEDLILLGSASGVLTIYEIQYGLNSIFIKKVGSETFPAPIVFISEYDGSFAITFGNYTAIYKIHRTLHYLMTGQSKTQAKASIKFFRSFYNPLPLKAAYIMTSPLYTIILIDNANIKSYSINGQFIKSVNNSAKYYGRFRDNQLHDVFYAIDEDKIICYSIPDLRNISIFDLPEHQQILGPYILHKTSINEIGYTHD